MFRSASLPGARRAGSLATREKGRRRDLRLALGELGLRPGNKKRIDPAKLELAGRTFEDYARLEVGTRRAHSCRSQALGAAYLTQLSPGLWLSAPWRPCWGDCGRYGEI